MLAADRCQRRKDEPVPILTFGKARSDKGRPDGCQDAIDLASEKVFRVENSNLAPDKICSR